MSATPEADAVIANDSGGSDYIANLATLARRLESQRDDALRQRDEWFSALSDLKENLAVIIPALETASGLKADDFRDTCPDNGLSSNEWAALWLARAIQEGAQNQEANQCSPSA